MCLVYFSVSSNEIPNLGEACRVFGKNIGNLDVYARTRTQLDGRPEQQEVFVEKALKTDVCVVTLMGGVKFCPAWETLTAAMEGRKREGQPVPWFHVQPIFFPRGAISIRWTRRKSPLRRPGKQAKNWPTP